MLINWLGLKGLINTIVTFVAFYMVFPVGYRYFTKERNCLELKFRVYCKSLFFINLMYRISRFNA